MHLTASILNFISLKVLLNSLFSQVRDFVDFFDVVDPQVLLILRIGTNSVPVSALIR